MLYVANVDLCKVELFIVFQNFFSKFGFHFIVVTLVLSKQPSGSQQNLLERNGDTW
jgi:hypothetical protein